MGESIWISLSKCSSVLGFLIRSGSMEAMLALWEKLSLMESKGSKYAVKDEPISGEYLLAAKFFTRRVLSLATIAKTFKVIWRTKKGFEVRDMGNHLVLFSFFDSSDVARVIQGEPWSFDKHLVVVQLTERHEDITSPDFSRTSFWVQLHGPSIGSMSHNTVMEICSVVGEVDDSASGEGERSGYNFLQVQVRVNNSQPMC